MMVVWMEISQDKYELPVAVANTAKDLARICGVEISTVRSSASRANQGHEGNRFCRFRSVEIESEG